MSGYEEKIATNTGCAPYAIPYAGFVAGAFYWVQLKMLSNELAAREFNLDWQPARFTGTSGETIGPTWDLIGIESAVGHHYVEVIAVGPEIVLR